MPEFDAATKTRRLFGDSQTRIELRAADLGAAQACHPGFASPHQFLCACPSVSQYPGGDAG